MFNCSVLDISCHRRRMNMMCGIHAFVLMQVTQSQAVAALAEAVAGAAAGLQGLRSGVVRFEVSLSTVIPHTYCQTVNHMIRYTIKTSAACETSSVSQFHQLLLAKIPAVSIHTSQALFNTIIKHMSSSKCTESMRYAWDTEAVHSTIPCSLCHRD